ncbi:bifunctional [glutamine synthetase] adenylyltransferase/[glutamine synthetase]-adenylyl-L-tyrosine phosphorylase [Janibacter sp. G56]|uniref:bifunctional [glutamine synthetase] adenylyltransferase/[glutamine synthetase]-adenylyl-L-tyrosine phosphorylase n=1 Tax=Janibacter sp. G56 TaxID=3418717 RepID=UPI003CFD29B5
MSTPRATSAAGRLARHGFSDPVRAASILADDALAGMGGDDPTAGPLVEALDDVADPDQALLALVRLAERIRDDLPGDVADLAAALTGTDDEPRRRLLAVLGASTALGDHLVSQPAHWRDVVGAVPRTPQERIDTVRAAVAEPGDLAPEDALRVAYRRELLGIAALDLTAEDQLAHLPEAAAALADLAEAALEAATDIARAEVGEEADRCRFAVIGMGKSGGRELNYISDVDVIFVAEPAGGADEAQALEAGRKIATAMMSACARATAYGSLWPVDAALRPEGKNGPLVRTVASHKAYYERWAKTWEFQALLKARPMAGDRDLGDAYVEAVNPFVWQASSRDNFVEDVQAMRRRVEDNVPAGEQARQIKLGRGGLRDVEFSVQLLQLVHGRHDPSIRSRSTLEGLAQLAEGGYVGREDAAVLDHAYRLLRALEHRIQLFRLRRTHLLPTAPADLRRLGRSMGHRQDPIQDVGQQWRSVAREVRRLHERLFYRPLLAHVARLSPSEARLSSDAARDRLAALGFRDPAGAIRHLEALTSGVSRRASIQRQLLPVMLSWFADEADPDAGLLAFRKVSEHLGTTHWYLRLLRDEGSAAERLAHSLGRSRFVAELLLSAPEAVAMLGDATGLVPRSRQDILRRMQAAAGRKDDAEAAMSAARAIRRTELFRVAVADLFREIDLDGVGRALTDISAATIEVGLIVAARKIEADLGREIGADLLVVGMGRLGGGEISYSSDADVLFVHRPRGGVAEDAAQRDAAAVIGEMRRLLGLPGSDPPLGLDADLRPEGKAGPLVRSLSSYRSYYERWSQTWEAQSLVRATPIAGDRVLADDFVALIDPIRWPADGLTREQVREIRRLKARMEAERLPRGADRRTHFKLGMGGLSDIEWTVQLIQLEHAHAEPALRTPATLPALAAAVEAGHLTPAEGDVLRTAWELASRTRNAGLLYRGRPVDSVPSNLREADGVGRIIGLPPASGQELQESYRRAARHARAVVDERFYGAI